jgi:uncharacterized protein
MINIRKYAFIFIPGIFMALSFSCGCGSGQPNRVLILSGANNHDWAATTPLIQKTLADSGMEVDICEQTSGITSDMLLSYDVIVSNFNNFKDKDIVWPKETKLAFLDFIRNGGGHVVLHAGGSSFYNWDEYHHIAASWGKQTQHGPVHDFAVTIEEPRHPICRGMKTFSVKDELWVNTQFPPGSEVLMSAYCSSQHQGNDASEPILAVSEYEKGRCVNLMLGHNVTAINNPGLKEVLIRCTAWAGSKDIQDYSGRNIRN